MGPALGPFTMQELPLQGLLLVSLIVKPTYSMFSDEKKNKFFYNLLFPVFRIRIRIRTTRVFLGHPDPYYLKVHCVFLKDGYQYRRL
jgi:hypothetical protein